MSYAFLFRLPQELWTDKESLRGECSSSQGIYNLTKMNKISKYLLMFWKLENKRPSEQADLAVHTDSNVTIKVFEMHAWLDFLGLFYFAWRTLISYSGVCYLFVMMQFL